MRSKGALPGVDSSVCGGYGSHFLFSSLSVAGSSPIFTRQDHGQEVKKEAFNENIVCGGQRPGALV